MTDLLKGNFSTQKKVVLENSETPEDNLESKLKKAALNSIGGSMVYVERTDMTWDGE